LFQTAHYLKGRPAISESETAFLVMLARQNAGTTQHRSDAKGINGWTWNPDRRSNYQSRRDRARGCPTWVES
jgi:hypothetical protein